MLENEIISDQEIDRVHANSNFADTKKRNIVRDNVLKVACGLHIGYIAQSIIYEHGLIETTTKRPTLTDLGKKYLWSCMKKNLT